jgi:hypothetical protein
MGKVMSARYVLAISAVVMALAPVAALAKGAPTPAHVMATVPVPLPSSLPDVSADKMLAGCGTHRFRDPNTHLCRGY